MFGTYSVQVGSSLSADGVHPGLQPQYTQESARAQVDPAYSEDHQVGAVYYYEDVGGKGVLIVYLNRGRALVLAPDDSD